MAKSIVESLSKAVVDLSEREPIRVLHVDDEAGFLKVAKPCLEMQGAFRVETASSVEEASEKLKKKTFDAVISDYMMPGKDGLEFLKELRGEGNNVPFIIFTGKGREEVAIRALNLGADGYFNKIGSPETVYGELAYGIRQVVERKKAIDAVWASEQKLRNIIDTSPDAIIWVDITGKITLVNRRGFELTGFSEKDFVGKNFMNVEALTQESKQKMLESFKKRLQGIDTPPYELEIVTKNREVIPAELSASPIYESGKIVGTQSVLRDLREREKTEQALRESEYKRTKKELEKSEERFKTMMEEAPIGICNTDLKGKITYVNKRFEEATGYLREEIVGKNGFKLGIMSDETLKSLAKRMKKRLTGKPSRLLEGRFKCKDGEWIWAEIEGRVIKRFGVPVGFQLAARDITERKRAEEERKRFEERLSALNTYSRDLNMAGSMEEIYRLTLDAMEKTLGFEHAFFMVVDKDMLCVVDQHGYPVNISTRLPLDGSKRGVSVKVARTGKPINVPDAEKEDAWVEFWPGIRSGLDVPVKIGRKVLGVIGVDSKSLSAFDEKDQKLLEILASHAATAMSNLEYAKNLEVYAREIQESKEKFERLFMNNPEAADYVGPDFHIIDVNPRFIELFGYSLDEVKGKHINEVVVPKDKMEEAEMFDRKAEKGYACYDTVRKRKDGSLVPVSISAAPITVEGKIIGIVGLYKDISQLKKAEITLRGTLEKLETVNEKLGVVGRLTRHDVRNKLSVIRNNVFLTKQKVAEDHIASEYLEDIKSAVRQTERIFDFARAYEKLGIEKLAYMDVGKVLKKATILFSDMHGVNVENDCYGLKVLADSLLRQIFYNLIHNSLKHGEKVSQIRVYYEEDGKDNLKLVYEDDGVGIPEAEKEKIFKEGYGKDSGYGLYLIRKMCEVYGWAIKETGEQGKGAQFTITIPKMNKIGKIAYQLH